MSELRVEMTWKDGLRFEATNAWGHTLVTDASKAAGGGEDGIKPTELLLYGVAACTGVDIVRIMKKKRQALTSLTIRVEGEQGDGYPKPFHDVRVHYVARGKGIDDKAFASAIELSESKYCVVSQTVQRETRVTTSYEIAATD